MTQIEHLPVMQMKAETPLPPNVHGRNEKGGIYYACKPVGQGQPEFVKLK